MSGLMEVIAIGTGLNLVVLLGWSYHLGRTLGKMSQKIDDINEKGCKYRSRWCNEE